MRLLGLALLAASAAGGARLAPRGGPRVALVGASRRGSRARVRAAPQEEPTDEAKRGRERERDRERLGAPLELDLRQDDRFGVPAGSAEELELMRAKVALIQQELDVQRVLTESSEEELERELGFLGESLPQFVIGSFMSIPEYEVPEPKTLAIKIGLAVFGFAFTLFLTKTIDGAVLEMLRPIVKWKVDNTPML
ncbi:hypothetical protein KFE25_006422 [Diacronema lutheri]|uniref:Uncharacterized protein n=1 Tax=Diacronema lutheri TaxID=2081491 RepID=A0A8J5XWU1_DIALT|nr:hypothetical protein KFE25_006422 [Diacronema lutheri]